MDENNENEIEDNNTPVSLVINKAQAMLLFLSLAVMPKKLEMGDLMKLSGGDGGGMGMMIGVAIMAISKQVKDSDREELTMSLKDNKNYVNAEFLDESVNTVTVDKDKLNILMAKVTESNKAMFDLEVEELVDLVPDDQKLINIINEFKELTQD